MNNTTLCVNGWNELTAVFGGGLPGSVFNVGNGALISASSIPGNIDVGTALGVSVMYQCPVLPHENFTVRSDATFTIARARPIKVPRP